MTVSLELKPETEEVLTRQALDSGMSLSQLLAQIVEDAARRRNAIVPMLPRFTPGQEPWRSIAARPDLQATQGDDVAGWLERMKQVAQAAPVGPWLSDDALSSEGIYED